MPPKGSILRDGVAPARVAAGVAAPFGSIEIKMLSGFLLAISLLLCGGAYTYRTSVQLAGSLEWMAHSQEVRATLAGLYGSLAGAELAQRDYLLTGQHDRLYEYTRFVMQVRDDLASATRLTSDNPAQQRNWAVLHSAVDNRLDAMTDGLVAYQRYGLPAARAVLGIPRPNGSTEEVRAAVERMDAVEVRLLTQRRTASTHLRYTTLISPIVTLALASAIFIALFRAAHREMRARNSAESDLLESNRLLNAELRDKAALLEVTNKELESFSYSVSHDLRAPLRAIDGFAQMMEEDCQERLDAEGKRYLSVIRQNSSRMGALIEDLLEFSRLGRQPIAHGEVNVDALVREVVEEVLNSEPRGERGVASAAPQIEVGPLPAARGDRGLLRQVWLNLIANAVKYSGKVQRPLIQVSGCEAGAENHYSVRDNGVGFNMQYAEQLFRVFQRLHHAEEFGGTGVGLAIVHRIVTRHGGRVWAEGVVNEGAVFSFALPKGES